MRACFTWPLFPHFRSRDRLDVRALLHRIVRIDDRFIAIFHAGEHLDTVAEVTANLDGLEMHHIPRANQSHQRAFWPHY